MTLGILDAAGNGVRKGDYIGDGGGTGRASWRNGDCASTAAEDGVVENKQAAAGRLLVLLFHSSSRRQALRFLSVWKLSNMEVDGK